MPWEYSGLSHNYSERIETAVWQGIIVVRPLLFIEFNSCLAPLIHQCWRRTNRFDDKMIAVATHAKNM